jgi:Zn-dependent protease
MAAMASAGRSGLQFTLAGFAVAVPLNTLLGVAIIAWLWLPSFAGGSPTEQWISAIVFAVALLASVLVHELAHAVMARRYDFPVIGITLWAFGGYTQYRPVRNSPGREAAISAAGPAATLVIAVLAWLVWQQIPVAWGMASDVVAAIAIANALVAVFNMLPGLPLDGGGVLSAAVWALTGSRVRGQRFAAYGGMVLAALIVAAPLVLSWRAGASPDLVFLMVSVLLGGFLFVGARGALQQADQTRELAGASAMDVAVPAIVVPETASVALLDALIAGRSSGDGLIALVGEPATGLRGYVLPQALTAVPVAARPATAVAAVTRTVPEWGWVPAAASAEEALDTLHDVGRPVVVLDAQRQPIGVIVGPRAAEDD